MGDEFSKSEVSPEQTSDPVDVKNGWWKRYGEAVLGCGAMLGILFALLGYVVWDIASTQHQVNAAINGQEYNLKQLAEYQGFKVNTDFVFVDLENSVVELKKDYDSDPVYVRVTEDVWHCVRNEIDVVQLEVNVAKRVKDRQAAEQYKKDHEAALERIRRGEALAETSEQK
ncbi:MAG: hypothetical protein G01um101419_511 [Parcubacteria group bacterium Gr01-1014_19]|nr:MAG: hypothetical protein G01um101419_511 [Parcubacteria group bacterium Gr01-1014_19]